MTAPARVLWLTKGLGRGGTERLLVNAVRCIDRDRFEVEVAYALGWKDHFVTDIASSGVAVHCLGQRSAIDLGWIRRLRDVVRRGRYDLVHAHMPVPAVAARVALGGRRRPAVVYTEHNLWSSHRWPTRLADALTYHRNTAVIAVSQAVADSVAAPSLRGWSPEITVIHHGIDLDAARRGREARTAARALLDIDEGAPVVGAVGNLSAKKDHKNLLAAVSLLLPSNPALRAVIVGEGPLRAELEAEAGRLGCAGAVVFTGSRDDVPQLLPAFDLFMVSSRAEGLPIALLEAMAAGIPCVATRVGGIPETVVHGNEGLLVDPGDPAALAEAASVLLGDGELRLRMGAAAQTRAAAFGIERAVRQIEQLYEQVLGATRPGPPALAAGPRPGIAP